MKNQHLMWIMAGLMSVSAVLFAADGGVVVVAPGTNVASVEAGLEAARQSGAKMIEVAAGEYFVDRTIVLDSRDNG